MRGMLVCERNGGSPIPTLNETSQRSDSATAMMTAMRLPGTATALEGMAIVSSVILQPS